MSIYIGGPVVMNNLDYDYVPGLRAMSIKSSNDDDGSISECI